jgi:hypothetical protein
MQIMSAMARWLAALMMAAVLRTWRMTEIGMVETMDGHVLWQMAQWRSGCNNNASGLGAIVCIS